MTVSQATARQPSLITPLNLSSVLDLTGEIINFVIMSGQGSDVSQIANLISKLNFYKLIPYPMDNMLNRSAQTGPPNVRKRRPVFPPAGRSSHCTHQVVCRTSFLSRQADVIASFSLSKPIKPLVS